MHVISNSVEPFQGIGHRGLGRSFRDIVGQRRASITENTVMAFAGAAYVGADYIELDVMLTKDRVPIVFHDFSVGVF